MGRGGGGGGASEAGGLSRSEGGSGLEASALSSEWDENGGPFLPQPVLARRLAGKGHADWGGEGSEGGDVRAPGDTDYLKVVDCSQNSSNALSNLSSYHLSRSASDGHEWGGEKEASLSRDRERARALLLQNSLLREALRQTQDARPQRGGDLPSTTTKVEEEVSSTNGSHGCYYNMKGDINRVGDGVGNLRVGTHGGGGGGHALGGVREAQSESGGVASSYAKLFRIQKRNRVLEDLSRSGGSGVEGGGRGHAPGGVGRGSLMTGVNLVSSIAPKGKEVRGRRPSKVA
jgi:hypothetical protein